jgi:hypothetical protein
MGQPGATIAIIRGGECCRVRALKEWLDAARIESGPLFRPVAKGNWVRDSRLTGKSVCDVTKDYADRVGLDAATFGAHSLRSGFLTSAARPGEAFFKMYHGIRAWMCCRHTFAMPTYSGIMLERGCLRQPRPASRQTEASVNGWL